MSFRRVFAHNLRRRRKAMRLSVEQAARLAGVERSAWSHWENALRVPKFEILPQIAKALQCKVSEIIPGG